MPEWKPLILLVEDDAEVAQLNARQLERQGYGTLIAYTASEARAFVNENQPDLCVLDIELPDGNGLSLCEELRGNTDAPVVFLTGKGEMTDKVAGLDSGGDYYLTKPYDMSEFIAVVQSLLRREGHVRERITEATTITKGSLTLKIDERKAFVNERDAELTLKEFNVLLMLVQNEDKELTGEVIYMHVWGTTMNNDSNAVRLTISRVKKKLNEKNAEDFAIFTKYNGGYVFVKM